MSPRWPASGQAARGPCGAQVGVQNGCAVLAGLCLAWLGLIFADIRLLATLQRVCFSEEGKSKPNNGTRLNRLFPSSCIKGTSAHL